MSSKIVLLLAMMFTAKGSFLQTPNQFQSTFNSTFLTENEKLFQPIIIPNITKSTEQPLEGNKTARNETVAGKISREVAAKENYSDEVKTAVNSLKFSSRYSTKQEELSVGQEEEKPKQVESRIENATTALPNPEKIALPATEKVESFLDRSDDLGDSEDKDDTFKYDATEPKEAERSEIASTTNEPNAELQRPTSFRSTSHPDDDLEDYETTASAEEIDSSEEKEEEEEEDGKRSVSDYYNSVSKNYHSIQTPLKDVKYRGAHSYRDSFEPEKVRTRLVSSMHRHHDKPSWPFSKRKPNIEELNEISDNDAKHDKHLLEGAKEEVRTTPKHLDLELAVQKDELKFDRNKKYNQIDERKLRKQQQKNLAAEEEKDDRIPFFKSLKQYQVDEEPRYQPTARGGVISKFRTKEDIWSSKALTPKSIFKTTTSKRPQQFGVSNELSPNFQGRHVLGPVVFNTDNLEEKKTTAAKHSTTQKVPIRSSYLKGLLENEKLDQEHLTNQKSEKSVFGKGTQHSRSFNHLEESDEMYNAILANIQSVFGIRTQSLKSNVHKGSVPEVNLEESRALTWSLPLIKRTKVN